MFQAVLQVITNGLFAGTVLAVPAVGFTLMVQVLGYPNFAIGAVATAGAYFGLVANLYLASPLVGCVVAAFLGAGLVAVAAERLVIRPFVSSGPIVAAVVSLSIGIILESSIRFIFGTRLHGLDIPILPDYRVGGIRVGDQQVDSLVFVTVAMALLWLMLRYTRAGRAMRAFADNASLARLKGVNASAMVTMVVFTGSGLAGIGGLLAGAQGALDPQLGARLLVSIFAASVLGGLGSVPGALLGALVIGVAEEMSVWLIAPAYRTVASFLIILLVLSLRPSGLLGKRG